MCKTKLVLAIGLLLLAGLLGGCQEEKVNVVQPPEDQAIKYNSETAALVTSVARRDGSYDDIIDGASCISVVLPVDVIANGVQVTVNTVEDIDTIEDIFSASSVDDDRLEIEFPILGIFPNHTQIMIDSKQTLNELIAECSIVGDADIECIDFLYPIKISLYNSSSQTADVITIRDDKELFNFFGYLKEADLVGFFFPITMVSSIGAEITVTDISSLNKLITEAEDDCDEDDHYKGPDELELAEILTQGAWIITYFFEDGDDKTSDYENFTFNFSSNGTFTASNGPIVYGGEWEIDLDDDEIELELDFDNDDSPLDELDEDWILIDFNGERIRLKDSSGGNTTFLTFERP
jgi:hypothetical protein